MIAGQSLRDELMSYLSDFHVCGTDFEMNRSSAGLSPSFQFKQQSVPNASPASLNVETSTSFTVIYLLYSICLCFFVYVCVLVLVRILIRTVKDEWRQQEQ